MGRHRKDQCLFALAHEREDDEGQDDHAVDEERHARDEKGQADGGPHDDGVQQSHAVAAADHVRIDARDHQAPLAGDEGPGGPAEVENEQHVDAVNDGGHGHEAVLGGKGGRKGDQGHEHQEEDVQPDKRRIELADNAEDRVMHEPEHAEDHEAQGIDEKFGPQPAQLAQQLGLPGQSPGDRHAELEDQQGHHDGENSVSQGLQALGGTRRFFCFFSRHACPPFIPPCCGFPKHYGMPTH